MDLRYAVDGRSFRQVDLILRCKIAIKVQIEHVLVFDADIIRIGAAQNGFGMLRHAFGLDNISVLLIADRDVHIGKIPPGIPCLPASVHVGLNKHRRHFICLVLNPVQIKRKPAGQDLIPELAVDHRVVQHIMPILMQHQGPGPAGLFESLHHQIRLF